MHILQQMCMYVHYNYTPNTILVRRNVQYFCGISEFEIYWTTYWHDADYTYIQLYFRRLQYTVLHDHYCGIVAIFVPLTCPIIKQARMSPNTMQ